jgi:hypothetical protein
MTAFGLFAPFYYRRDEKYLLAARRGDGLFTEVQPFRKNYL